jgi:hypothetical protein
VNWKKEEVEVTEHYVNSVLPVEIFFTLSTPFISRNYHYCN